MLKSDKNKQVIINSLQWLCGHNVIQVYGYVIMPNHIHLMWKQLKMNGKELPKNSFEKYTAQLLIKNMQSGNSKDLDKFTVAGYDRKYNIWQRDPLAIKIFSREMAQQKLIYMHNNPLQEHWKLSTIPENYLFSSAAFYNGGIDIFNILTHYMDVF